MMCLYSLEPQTSSKNGAWQHHPLARGQRFGGAMDQQMIRSMQHSGLPSYSASHHSHHLQNVAKPTHSATTSYQQMEMQQMSQMLGPSVGYVPQMLPQMPPQMQHMLPPGYVPQMSPHMQSQMLHGHQQQKHQQQKQQQQKQQQQQQQQHDIQLMKNNCTTYNQRPQQHRKRPQPPQLQVRMGGNPMIYANEHQRYTHGIEVGANETNRHSSLLLPTQTTPRSIVASSSPLHQSISHTKTNKRQRTLPPKKTDLQQHQQHEQEQLQRQQQIQFHQLVQQQQLHQQLQQVQRSYTKIYIRTPRSIVASSSPLHQSISHTKTNKRQRTLPPKKTDLQQHQQHEQEQLQRQQQIQFHQLVQQQQLHQQLQQVQRSYTKILPPKKTDLKPIASANM